MLVQCSERISLSFLVISLIITAPLLVYVQRCSTNMQTIPTVHPAFFFFPLVPASRFLRMWPVPKPYLVLPTPVTVWWTVSADISKLDLHFRSKQTTNSLHRNMSDWFLLGTSPDLFWCSSNNEHLDGGSQTPVQRAPQDLYRDS